MTNFSLVCVLLICCITSSYCSLLPNATVTVTAIDRLNNKNCYFTILASYLVAANSTFFNQYLRDAPTYPLALYANFYSTIGQGSCKSVSTLLDFLVTGELNIPDEVNLADFLNLVIFADVNSLFIYAREKAENYTVYKPVPNNSTLPDYFTSDNLYHYLWNTFYTRELLEISERIIFNAIAEISKHRGFTSIRITVDTSPFALDPVVRYGRGPWESLLSLYFNSINPIFVDRLVLSFTLR